MCAILQNMLCADSTNTYGVFESVKFITVLDPENECLHAESWFSLLTLNVTFT